MIRFGRERPQITSGAQVFGVRLASPAPRLRSMSDGGSANSINAKIELELLAAQNPYEPDPAEERAERLTRAAQIVVGAAATVGFTWLMAGTMAGLVALAIAGALGLGYAVRRRLRVVQD